MQHPNLFSLLLWVYKMYMPLFLFSWYLKMEELPIFTSCSLITSLSLPSPTLQATIDLLSFPTDYLAFSKILYDWNHKVFILCSSWDPSCSTVILRFINDAYISVHSFYTAEKYVVLRACHYLFVYSSVDIWVVSSFWQLQIKLLRTSEHQTNKNKWRGTKVCEGSQPSWSRSQC